MCRSFFTIALVLLGAGTLALEAAPVDPQGVFDTQIAGIPVIPVDPFSFSSNANGGGVFNFQNVSGNDWIGVDWHLTLPVGQLFSMSGGPFYGSFTVTSTPSTIPGDLDYDIHFDNPINGGILNNRIFSINLNNSSDDEPNLDPNGSGGWGANTMITIVQTAVPEPGSLWLLGGGIALLASVRRLWLRG